MKVLSFLTALLLVLPVPASPQTSSSTALSPQRDPQALAVLQSSVASMGALPTDSVAAGNVSIVAGSLTSAGTIRILTRGLEQTSEQIQLPDTALITSYSLGLATETKNGTLIQLSLQRSPTARSYCFPLPFVAAVLSNTDEAFQYIRLEGPPGTQTHHVRVWNTFTSNPLLQGLAETTVADLPMIVSTQI